MCILPHTEIWQWTMLIFFKVCLRGKISCQPLYRFQKIGGKFYWSRTYKNLGPLVWSKDLQDSKDPEGSSMYHTFTLLFLLHAHHESWSVSALFRENKRTRSTDFPAISGMALREQVEGSKGLREREGQHLPGEASAQTTWGILNN